MTAGAGSSRGQYQTSNAICARGENPRAERAVAEANDEADRVHTEGTVHVPRETWVLLVAPGSLDSLYVAVGAADRVRAGKTETWVRVPVAVCFVVLFVTWRTGYV